MMRKNEADSGLRAGFIREDEAKQRLAQSQANPQNQEKEPLSPPPPASVVNAEAAKATPETTIEDNGPKVSVQGVSGRMITGVIKATKRKPKEKEQSEAQLPSVGESLQEAAPQAEAAAKPQPTPAASPSPLTSTSPAVPLAQPSPAATAAAIKPVLSAQVKEGNSANPKPKPESSESKQINLGNDTNTKVETQRIRVETETRGEPETAPAKKMEQQTPVDLSPSSERASAALQPKEQSAERKLGQVPSPAKTTAVQPAGSNSAEQRREQAQTASTAQAASAGSSTTTASSSSQTAERKPVAAASSEVKRDQGVTSSYAELRTSSGKAPIRPQKGNYIGRDSQTPAYKSEQQNRRSSAPGTGASTQRSSGGYGTYAPRTQSSGGQGGGGYYNRSTGPGGRSEGGRPSTGERSSEGRPNNFGRTRPNFSTGGRPSNAAPSPFSKDKDGEEAPRRTRSPKQPKRDARPGAAPAADPLVLRKQENRRTFGASKDNREHDRHEIGEKASRSLRNQQDLAFDEESLRRGRRRKERRQEAPTAVKAVLSLVKLPASLTVKELAEILKKSSAEVISKLMTFGVMATVNQEIDYDTAEVIAQEFGIKSELLVAVTEEDILFDETADEEADLEVRPPVVVVMGHVDHGKTSLLDWIRKAKVASGEAGGITQHIGAYMVDVNDKQITFLDTPGHEAFTTMRARGAQVTDIAILVVAADDGVMPQTIEAINHARAANTEIIVAINKIDKPGVNLDRVKQELATHNLLGPEWGGDVTIVPVSAKTGENMNELLDMVLLTAELLELKANPQRQAKGTVVEARLDKNRGPLATVLVQRGTLKVGATVVVGTMIGNIRAMNDDRGCPITAAGPSVPVEIMGLPAVPEDGDVFYEVENERVAKNLADRRRDEERERSLHKSSKLSLDNLFAKMAEGETKELNIIIKADVQGSVEAVVQSLEKLSNNEVKTRVIHSAVGAITESDVRLADVSNAIIIGFNVRPANTARELAESNSVDIRLYRVIYNAIEDIEKAMKGMLAPTFEEEILGHATVRELYKVSGVGTIAGCYVTDGKMVRNASVRILRNGVVVHEGELSSLKRFKDDVREVAQGYECGLSIARYNDLKLEDQFEMYKMKEVARA